MPNRLIHENSPYLLQHAHNPVDWYPWGEEALNRARNEDKPIFVSIGYMACHWCHVMEHESFEDPVTAELMNKHFINIKVDREERPDLDSIYMSATVSMTGSGGWPMSVFLTPELQPFYAGTYFPPTPRFNMPSFRDLLTGVANAWQSQRPEVLRVSSQVTEHIQRASQASGTASFPLTHSLLNNAADHLHNTYDWGFGGWGSAPKFPQPVTIEFLLLRAIQKDETSDQVKKRNYMDAARHALQAMARGGMYDVVGGGFARYSVDNHWRVPHFEKMLTDNALLAQVYLHAHLITGDRHFRQVCMETLNFMMREMSNPQGGFFSSLDADSEDEEGKYYVWQYVEIEQVLGVDFEFFKTAYGLTPSGNWEGKIVLQRAMDDSSLAARFKITEEQAVQKLAECHARLLELRETRIRPATDDKILTGWNALAITSFAEAGRYLRRPDYTARAASGARFLLYNLLVEGRLLRSWRDGQAKHNAYLEDHANLILALLALYQSDPKTEWYVSALSLANKMVAEFSDPDGGFFDTRADHEVLLLRPKDTQDNAIPSGNSMAAAALLLLSAYGDHPEWRQPAEAMLGPMLESAIQYPTAFARWLCTADFALGPIHEVALLGQVEQLEPFYKKLWEGYRPHLVAAAAGFPPPENIPTLLKERPLVNGQASAYVCRDFVCQQPVNTVEALATQLKEAGL